MADAIVAIGDTSTADAITATNNTSAANPITAVDANSTANVEPTVAAMPNGTEDLVSFSIPAQVFLLAQQGAGLRDIAEELDVSRDEVLAGLDIVVSALKPVKPTATSTEKSAH